MHKKYLHLVETLISDDVEYVLLTGGTVATSFYMEMCDYLEQNHLKITKKKIYFTDERCVPLDHEHSNYRLVTESFSKHSSFTKDNEIYPIVPLDFNSQEKFNAYTLGLPVAFDFVLLTIGDDGHIASLFPYAPALDSDFYGYTYSASPIFPYERITLAPPILAAANNIFVLAITEPKREMYEFAKQNPDDFHQIPARLVLEKNWIF